MYIYVYILYVSNSCFGIEFVFPGQLNLEQEARNLVLFQRIMKDRDTVKFPTPIFPFVTQRVLVETFEVSAELVVYAYITEISAELVIILSRVYKERESI